MKNEKIKNEKSKNENMKNKKTKRIILYFLIVLVLSTIFVFSSEPGKKSENTSDAFAGTIIDKVANITNKDITENKKKDLIVNSRFIVRKVAHFSIYFLLGILIYQLLKTYNKNKIVVISILICFAFGCLDEFHQVFIPERTARFYDCLIDTLGSTTGIYILYFIDRVKLKRKII